MGRAAALGPQKSAWIPLYKILCKHSDRLIWGEMRAVQIVQVIHILVVVTPWNRYAYGETYMSCPLFTGSEGSYTIIQNGDNSAVPGVGKAASSCSLSSWFHEHDQMVGPWQWLWESAFLCCLLAFKQCSSPWGSSWFHEDDTNDVAVGGWMCRFVHCILTFKQCLIMEGSYWFH